MSVIQRQLLWGIVTSMIVFIFVTISFVLVFPVASWYDLWSRELMDIPFILFVTSISLVTGILSGFVSGFY